MHSFALVGIPRHLRSKAVTDFARQERDGPRLLDGASLIRPI
jgi:hypothetical protein